VSLQEYVDRMPEQQTFIYFITGASLASVKNSPMLERLNKKGYECMFMIDPLDEYVVQQLSEFDGKKLQSVTKDIDLKLSKKDKEKEEKLDEEFKDLTAWLKGVYGDKVEKVSISHRLTKSPCVVTTGQYGWTANMERIMKAQTFSDSSAQGFMQAKKTLELNPRHPIIKELATKSKADPSDKALTDLATMMLDSALLVSGFHLENPQDLSARLLRVLSTGLQVDPNVELEEEPEEPEEPEPSADASDAPAADGDATPKTDAAADDDADTAHAQPGDEGEDIAAKLAADKPGDKDEL